MFVERFLAWIDTASDDKRAEAATSLALAYLECAQSDEEREMAEAAMAVLVDDPSPTVRLALAEVLATDPASPRHVVMSLAADTAEIAAVVLARSPVFVDPELVDVAGSGSVEAQIAVACRPAVSAVVSAALAEVGDEEACIALLSNPAADILPDSLHRIGLRFGGNAAMRRLLLQHGRLRPRTRILLIEKLGEAVEARAADTASFSASRVGALARETSDKAIIAYAARASEADLAEITATVIAGGRMTAAFLLRAICMGNISLFAHALAALGDLPLARVEAVLIRDRRGVFRALYARAGLPDIAYGVFAGAIDTWRRLLAEPEPVDPGRLAYLVTRDLLSAYRGSADPRLDTLLVLLRRLAADAARDNARREATRIAESARAAAALPAPDAVVSQTATEDEVAAEAWATAEPAPKIELPQEVVKAFALYFAEEIAELEDEMAEIAAARAAEAIAAGLSALPDAELLEVTEFEPLALPEIIANDDNGPVTGTTQGNGPVPPDFVPGEPASAVVDKVRVFMRGKMAA